MLTYHNLGQNQNNDIWRFATGDGIEKLEKKKIMYKWICTCARTHNHTHNGESESWLIDKSMRELT